MSTDGLQELLMQLQTEYGKRLRQSSQQDGGAVDAVNHAIAQAKGEVVGGLTQTTCTPKAQCTLKLPRTMAYFEKHPNDHMVYWGGQHIDAAGVRLVEY